MLAPLWSDVTSSGEQSDCIYPLRFEPGNLLRPSRRGRACDYNVIWGICGGHIFVVEYLSEHIICSVSVTKGKFVVVCASVKTCSVICLIVFNTCRGLTR